jgi:hypothetical protein
MARDTVLCISFVTDIQILFQRTRFSEIVKTDTDPSAKPQKSSRGFRGFHTST